MMLVKNKTYTKRISDNVIGHLEPKMNQDFKAIYRYSLCYNNYTDFIQEDDKTISFVSNIYNESLLDGLLNYYKNIIEQFKDAELIERNTHNNPIMVTLNGMFLETGNYNDIYSIDRERWLLEDHSVYNDFMEQNKDSVFDEKLTLKFILHYFGSLDEDLTENMDSFVNEFLDKHPNDKHYSIKQCYESENTDALYYCIPVMSLLSPNEIKFMIKWWNMDVVNYFSYKYNLIKFSYKYSDIKFNEDNIMSNTMYDDMKFKDYVTLNNFDLKNNNNHSDMFMFENTNNDVLEFLDDLPVRDVLKIDRINRLFTTNVPVSVAKDVCELILAGKFKFLDKKNANNTLDNFFDLLDKNDIQHHLNKELFVSTLTQYDNSYFNLLFIQYITDRINYNESVTEILDNTIIEESYDYINFISWYDDDLLGYVVYKLWDKIGTSAAYNIIDDVRRTETRLSMEQWLEFIDNYDEYKNIPTPWLEALI